MKQRTRRDKNLVDLRAQLHYNSHVGKAYAETPCSHTGRRCEASTIKCLR